MQHRATSYLERKPKRPSHFWEIKRKPGLQLAAIHVKIRFEGIPEASPSRSGYEAVSHALLGIGSKFGRLRPKCIKCRSHSWPFLHHISLFNFTMADLQSGIYIITNVGQKYPVSRGIREGMSLLPKSVVSFPPGMQPREVSLPVIFTVLALTLFPCIVGRRETSQWEFQAEERRLPRCRA
jgi:hypothetical protein